MLLASNTVRELGANTPLDAPKKYSQINNNK